MITNFNTKDSEEDSTEDKENEETKFSIPKNLVPQGK